MLATTDNSSEGVRLWDVAGRVHPRRLMALPGNGETTRTVAFTPNGRMLLTSSVRNTLSLWDLGDRATLVACPS